MEQYSLLSRHDSGRQREIRSPVDGTIYANVIWPGMKWKYATTTEDHHHHHNYLLIV